MQTEDAFDVRSVEYSGIAHFHAASTAFFGGLKQELDGASELRLSLVQQLCRAEQHRCVTIVPAGVHLAVDLAAKRNVRLFLNRQRVHIGSQGNTGRLTATQRRHDARLGDTSLERDSQLRQRVANKLAGSHFLVHQLGMAM